MAAAHAARVVEAAAELGADRHALCEESGLDLARIEGGDPVGARPYLAFLAAAARHLNDPLFGVRAGFRSRLTDVRAYSLVLMACPDVRNVIAQVLRFESLEHDLLRTELVEADGVAHLRAHSPWLGEPGGRHMIYYAAAGLLAQSRWLIGMDLPLFTFASTFAAPDLPEGEFERALGAPTRWNSAFNEVSFPAAILDIAIPSANPAALPALRELAEAQFDARARNGEPAVVRTVRDAILQRMSRGAIELPTIAAALATAPRTLQRRLREAGVSFSDLLNDARRDQARRYLLDRSLSMTEIALLLGFSEQSAFNHAFRGWFGVTPGQWRAGGGKAAN